MINCVWHVRNAYVLDFGSIFRTFSASFRPATQKCAIFSHNFHARFKFIGQIYNGQRSVCTTFASHSICIDQFNSNNNNMPRQLVYLRCWYDPLKELTHCKQTHHVAHKVLHFVDYIHDGRFNISKAGNVLIFEIR